MPDEPSPETQPDTVPDSEETGTARPNIPQAVLDALPDDIRTSVIQAATCNRGSHHSRVDGPKCSRWSVGPRKRIGYRRTFTSQTLKLDT